MSGSIIVVGSTWPRWEWYALNRHTDGVARFGLVNVHEEGSDQFYQVAEERSCRPDHLREADDAEKWIREQDVILLTARDSHDYHLWQTRGLDHAIKDFWLGGGIILAEFEAAGLLFSWGIDRSGNPFRGMEFLQGTFCPQYEQFSSSVLPLVEQEEISSGWGVERWSGLHFRGRHLQRALTHDETSKVFSLRADGQEEIRDVDLVPY